MIMTTRADLLWAAGLLEGEGAFCITTPPSGLRKGRIQCQGVDPEVLDRLRETLGTGHVNGPYDHRAPTAERRLSWTYQINRQADVARVARALKPHMSRRRQNQIARMLDAMGEL